MKLTRVEINSFKRFAEPATIDLDSKLIAVVGPNEAGKSSLLQALQHLNSATEFRQSSPNKEITRELNLVGDHVILKAKFYLETADKDAISNIKEAKDSLWLIVEKQVDGNKTYEIQPRPHRDLSKRMKLVSKLQKLAVNRRFSELDQDPENNYSTEEIQEIISEINVEKENLNEEVIQKIEHLSQQLTELVIESDPQYIKKLVNELEELKKTEQEIDPHQAAIEILSEYVPRFWFFEEGDRQLQSTYEITADQELPAALKNLARFAGLDMYAVAGAVMQGDNGKVETLKERANDELIEKFKWSQSEITVRLSIDGTTLHILVGSSKDGYASIAEQSDGLRQYVALLAFASAQEEKGPHILLIDEAENHLHYDAQADLVQMFAKQNLAEKIIYTTHSVGCLPEDLGTGVRLVATTNETRSTIKNWFWEDADPGFSPILFGMGASTCAFMPFRYALVAEGPTDMMLLPSLLREVLQKNFLGFQIVPGLSNASDNKIAIMNVGAPRTAYLVDSDQGGDALKKKLIKAGIPETRIIELKDGNQRGLVLEDFIDISVYCSAVNEVLHQQFGDRLKIQEKELSKSNRPKIVEAICNAKHIEPPSKRKIAYHILDRRSETQLAWQKRHAALEQLFNDIKRALNLPLA